MEHSKLNWARLVSNLCSPPIIWAILVLPIAFRFTSSQNQAIFCVLIYIVLVCLIPAIYVVWMVKRGHISDIHMKIRGERLRPFLVSILCTGSTWAILRLSNTPVVMPMMAAIMLTQLVVMTIITLVWQISMHAMSMTGAVVAIGVFFGLIPALIVMPLVPLVGAARLQLRRHTLAQVIAGTLLGGVVTAALLSVS
jgi:membrane-associated phospholipid phosphatase